MHSLLAEQNVKSVPIGQRKYRLAIWTLVFVTPVACVGIWRAPENLAGVAGVISAYLIPIWGAYSWANRAEHQDKSPVKIEE